MLHTGKSRVRFPVRSSHFSFDQIPSNHTLAVGSTQPLTEMSTRDLPGGKQRLASKAYNVTAICEPIA
jgi:hypothetical protein